MLMIVSPLATVWYLAPTGAMAVAVAVVVVTVFAVVTADAEGADVVAWRVAVPVGPGMSSTWSI